MKKNIEYVDPFYGCYESELPAPKGIAAKWFFIKAQTGNCLPAACRPFGAVTECAYTGGYPSGYSPYWANSDCRPPLIMDRENRKALGLSHFHHSGTGYIDEFYNFFIITPVKKAAGRYTYYDLGDESAVPGYYAFSLDDIRCEGTVSDMAALHRFTYPEGSKGIVIDLKLNGLVNMGNALAPQGEVISVSTDNKSLTAHINYSTELYASAYSPEAKSVTDIGDGRYFIELDEEKNSAELFIGFSFSSKGRAIANLEKAREEGFKSTKAENYRLWDNALSAIDIKADEKTKRKFYSCLYHCFIKPVNVGKDSPHYKGDRFVGTVDYCTMWDIYKSELPLIFMLNNAQGKRIVDSFVDSIEVFGNLPICLMLTTPSGNCDGQARALACLSIYDAYLRGVEGVDWSLALEAAASELRRDYHRDFFIKEEPLHRPPQTIDLAAACYAVSKLAKAIGRNDIAEEFAPYSTKWIVAYDESDGLCVNEGEYYEGSRHNYSFRILPHMEERIKLSDNYIGLLDSFFGYDKADAVQFTDRSDRSKLIEGLSRNGFEGFNNETDMETPYVYNFVGRIDRTAEVVRGGESYMFAEGRGALSGNDDSGGLSSLYVMNALGIFPAAGLNLMLFGSPCVDEAEIYLLNGSILRIIAENNSNRNIYPQMITFNGNETGTGIKVTELMKGGTLRFVMSDKPRVFSEI